MNKKADRLLEVARLRQKSRWDGYKCVGDFHDGIYECDFVSPYTKGAGNVDAEVMVLLQDWASDDVLSGPILPERLTFGRDPRRRTNQRLVDLLREHFSLELKDVYATNVFPFVKIGAMSTSIRNPDMVRAAREFALPQISIVEPRLAICLGKAAFNAVAQAVGCIRATNLDDAIASPFQIDRTVVWCQAHTGQQGANTRNRVAVDQVSKDWRCMAKAYISGFSGF